MIEPRTLEEDELEELTGQDVKVVAVGSDGFIVRMPNEVLVAVSLCLSCGAHLSYYEIDADMIVTGGDPDILAG